MRRALESLRLISLSLILSVLPLSSRAQSPIKGLIPVPKADKSKPRLRNLSTWELGCGLILASERGYLQYLDLLRARESDFFNLLSGNPALTTSLERGTFNIILDFRKKLILKEFILKSFSLEGQLKLYTSPKLNLPGHRSWKAIGTPTQIRAKDSINLPLGFLETQFLMLVLDVQTAGAISSLSCMGSVEIVKRGNSDPKTIEDNNPDDDIPFNYARFYEGAKVGYVSGGQAQDANQVLDEDFSEPYSFPANETHSIMVIDLEDQRSVDSLSVLFDGPAGNFDFIFTDELPEGMEAPPPEVSKEGSTKAIQSSYRFERPCIFGTPLLLLAAAEGSLEETVSLGKLRAKSQALPSFIQALPDKSEVIQETVKENADRLHVNFKDIKTRYLVINFERDPNSPNTTRGLNIYQVNLMGDVDVDAVLPQDIPVNQENLNLQPSTTNLDTQESSLDNLDTPIDPPEVPVVSP
jgi:hypothetical protein